MWGSSSGTSSASTSTSATSSASFTSASSTSSSTSSSSAWWDSSTCSTGDGTGGDRGSGSSCLRHWLLCYCDRRLCYWLGRGCRDDRCVCGGVCVVVYINASCWS